MSEATYEVNAAMKLKALVLVAVTLLTGAAQAQPVWTFDQVLQSALSSHPAMLGKRSEESAAQAEQKGAEWQRYPAPSVEAAKQNDGGTASLVRIEQPLWTGGRISASIAVAGSRLDAAGAAVEEAKLDLSLRVIAAYAEALRQKARQQYATSGLKEHEKLLDMIRRRVGQEVSSQTDERLAESRLFQAANDLSAITQALNNALAQLGQLSGRPVAEVSEQGLSESGTLAGLEATINQILDWSPMLRRLAFEEDAADADIASKRSAYMPQLAMRVEKDFGPMHESRIMLVMQAQPGAGLSAVSGVNAAIARREAARLASQTAERDLRERITLDWNELTAARLRLENANRSRTMSAEVFDSYTRQYVIGRKSWIDVLNAVREATQSDWAAEDARAQLLSASLRLRAQSGTLIASEETKL